VKVTDVPSWTAVPPASMTAAVTSMVPLMGTVVWLTDSVIVDPVGEVRGTLSHATPAHNASKTER
jgi:hypothetical protein